MCDIINRKSDMIKFDIQNDDYISEIKFNSLAKIFDKETKEMLKFLANYKTQKNDKNTNIIAINPGRSYNIPIDKIPELFEKLHKINESKCKISLAERQLEYSGIMIDFDIYQKNEKSLLNENFIRHLTTYIFHYIIKLIKNFESIHTYVGITKKQKPIYQYDKKCYKDGLHILFPGIKCTKMFKSILLNDLVQSKSISKLLYAVNPAKGYKPSDFIDLNSKSVFSFFIGCSTKINSPPYKLVCVYEAKYPKKQYIKKNDIVLNEVTNFFKKTCQSCIEYEFSLNFQNNNKNAIIKKLKYNLSDIFINQIHKQTLKNNKNDEELFFNKLSIQSILDPELREIRDLAYCLDSKKWDDYNTWIKLLILLKEQSETMKPLAEELSRTSKKFNLEKFNEIWDNLQTGKSSNPLTLKTLHKWAKQDNEKGYKNITHKSFKRYMAFLIYDNIKLGKIGHYDIAKLLFTLHKYKYVVSGLNHDKKNSCWYEFITPFDNYKKGELYKWKSYERIPPSLSKYISGDKGGLTCFLKEYLNDITQDYNNASNDYKIHYQKIITNIRYTCYNLNCNNFKSGIDEQCHITFWNPKFYDALDKDGNLLGVGNGVLNLKNLTLYQKYHNFLISKFTPIDYVEFNPRDSKTKQLIIGLRNLFPEDETETFNFVMSYLSTALSGNEKDQIILFLFGEGSNGKSWLLEMMEQTLGNYSDKISMTFLTAKENSAENATPQLMKIKNKRFIYGSESNKNEILNSAKIKELTGYETITGRHLYKEHETFIPHSIYVLASNSELEISDNTYGTWRRIKLVNMKMKFKEKNEINKNNKYEKEINPEFQKMRHDQQYLSKFLSILVWYYRKLQYFHHGKVILMPHDRIKYETNIYQNNQDIMNKFINERCVIKKNKNYIISFHQILELFAKWKNSYGITEYRTIFRIFNSKLKKSSIQNYIVTINNDNFIKGLGFLDMNEPIDKDDIYFRNKKKNNIFKNKFKSETSLEYYKNLCDEYDKLKFQLNIVNNHDKN